MTKVTMGSKKEETTVENKQEETKQTASNRQSSRNVQPNERPATKKRLRADRPSSGFWYLQDTADLEGVTAEASNPELGITEIKVYEPSENQWANGTVATVTLETIIGQVKGIQVIDSTRDESIYIRMQSRSYERDGQKQYVNDLTLDRKVQAQILRYVNTMLESAE